MKAVLAAAGAAVHGTKPGTREHWRFPPVNVPSRNVSVGETINPIMYCMYIVPTACYAGGNSGNVGYAHTIHLCPVAICRPPPLAVGKFDLDETSQTAHMHRMCSLFRLDQRLKDSAAMSDAGRAYRQSAM